MYQIMLYGEWSFLMNFQTQIFCNITIYFVGHVSRFMVFNATFNTISVTSISWWSVLLVEETRVPGENHRPVTSH